MATLRCWWRFCRFWSSTSAWHLLHVSGQRLWMLGIEGLQPSPTHFVSNIHPNHRCKLHHVTNTSSSITLSQESLPPLFHRYRYRIESFLWIDEHIPNPFIRSWLESYRFAISAKPVKLMPPKAPWKCIFLHLTFQVSRPRWDLNLLTVNKPP